MSFGFFDPLAIPITIGHPDHSNFLSDSTEALVVKRTVRDLTKTGTGTGDIYSLYGTHTHSANTSYRIEIDTAGEADDNNCTFRWSDDGGATWNQELIPVSFNYYALVGDLKVKFTTGTYDLGDFWDFTAIATGSQLYDLKVDTTNSQVWIGTELRVANDADFKLFKSSSLARLQFDAQSFIGLTTSGGNTLASWQWETGYLVQFNRTSNELGFTLNNSSVGMSASRISVVNASGDPYGILWETTNVVAFPTPGTSQGALYGRLVINVEPYWINELGVEYPILYDGMAHEAVVTLSPATSFTLTTTTFAVVGLQTISGTLDVAGHVAIGGASSVSTTQVIVAGIAATSSGTWRGFSFTGSLVASANSTNLTGHRLAGSFVGTGFTGLSLTSITAQQTINGGTFTALTGIRSAVTADAATVVALYKGLEVNNPTGPAAGSGSAYGTYVDVPQGANWASRVGSYVLGGAVGDIIERYETTKANTDPQRNFQIGSVNTTDATANVAVTGSTVTIPATTTVYVMAEVVARRTGGTAGTAEDGATYSLRAGVKNVAGTATLLTAATQDRVEEDVAGYNAILAVTGATVQVQVTGVLDTSITWVAYVTWMIAAD